MSWKIGTPDTRLDAPATERNRETILSVLKTVLPTKGQVLEIASGTGQHLTFFAPHFPALTWQPSDPDLMHLASIEGWMEQLPAVNILPPLQTHPFS
jgi:tRNA G46 methylase TrmB